MWPPSKNIAGPQNFEPSSMIGVETKKISQGHSKIVGEALKEKFDWSAGSLLPAFWLNYLGREHILP